MTIAQMATPVQTHANYERLIARAKQERRRQQSWCIRATRRPCAAPYKAAQQRRIDPIPEPVGEPLIDALIGAVGEHLAQRWGLSVPIWTQRPVHFALEEPRFLPDSRALRGALIVESPPAFRSRLLFTSAEPLDRARFPNVARARGTLELAAFTGRARTRGSALSSVIIFLNRRSCAGSLPGLSATPARAAISHVVTWWRRQRPRSRRRASDCRHGLTITSHSAALRSSAGYSAERWVH